MGIHRHVKGRLYCTEGCVCDDNLGERKNTKRGRDLFMSHHLIKID